MDLRPFLVTEVSVVAGEEVVVLIAADRRQLRFQLEADCCSHSYFTPEGIEAFRGLVGGTLAEIEKCESPKQNDQDGEVRWHLLKITTDKATATIDWRNDSNGYYDGWIEWTFEAAK